MDELPWLTVDQFGGRVGEVFEVHGDGPEPVPMLLAEVESGDAAGGRSPSGAERRQFSLLFRGPVDCEFPQAIYRLEHDELGRLDLFLVPLGPDADGSRFEAVFA